MPEILTSEPPPGSTPMHFPLWPSQLECWLQTIGQRAEKCTQHEHSPESIKITSAKLSVSDPDTIVIKGSIIQPAIFGPSGGTVLDIKDLGASLLSKNHLKTIIDWESGTGRKSGLTTFPLSSGTSLENPICVLFAAMCAKGTQDETGEIASVKWRWRGTRDDFECSLTVESTGDVMD